jgi:hypothetical protein
MIGGYPGGGGTIPGTPKTERGITIIPKPAGLDKIGRIVGRPDWSVVVVLEIDPGFPFKSLRVVVLNIPCSMPVCGGM